MSTITSEIELSALEKSKLPARELLDQAASIIGLSASSEFPPYQRKGPETGLASDTLKFRHQWLLRWILKQLVLSTSSSITHTATSELPSDIVQNGNLADLRHDCRVWALLSIVLAELPQDIARKILIEKTFCDSLAGCLQAVLAFLAGHTKHGPEVQIDPSGSISDAGITTASSQRHGGGDVLFRLSIAVAQAVDQVIEILRPSSQDDTAYPAAAVRSTSSYETMCVLTARVLDLCSTTFTMTQDQEISQGQSLEHLPSSSTLRTTAYNWFQLWSRSRVSAKKTKQAPQKVFNEIMLTSVLRFIHSFPDDNNASAMQELKRVIATHTVLPIREAFFTAETAHRRVQATSPEDQIRGTYRAMFKLLESATEAIRDSELVHIIYEIACSLVPRTNMTVRIKESAWLDALWVGLLRLNQLGAMWEGDMKDFAKIFDAELDDAFSRAIRHTPEQMWRALGYCGFKPSSLYWTSFVGSALRYLDNEVPAQYLVRIVQANPATFAGNPTDNELSLLNAILSYPEQLHTLTNNVLRRELRLYNDQVLIPVLHECGRSRRLGRFCELWIEKMSLTFARHEPNHDDRSLYHWLDPQLLSSFEEVCRTHPPTSLCKTLIDEICHDFTDGLSSFHLDPHIPARCVVAISLLSVLSSEPTIKAILDEKSSVLRTGTLTCQDEIYQNEFRWVFKKLYVALIEHGTTFEMSDEQGSMYSSSCFVGVRDPFCREQTFLDSYWAFHTLMLPSLIAASSERPLFRLALRNLLSLIEATIQASPTTKAFKVRLPDGSSENMQTPGKLFVAVLGRLATLPTRWIEVYREDAKRLVLACVALQCLPDQSHVQPDTEPTTGAVATMCAAIINNYLSLSRESYITLFLEAVSEHNVAGKMFQIPQQLNERLTAIDSKQANNLLKLFSEEIPAGGIFQNDISFLGYMASLSRLLNVSHSGVKEKVLKKLAHIHKRLDVPVSEGAQFRTMVQIEQACGRLARDLVNLLLRTKTTSLLMNVVQAARSGFARLSEKPPDGCLLGLSTYRDWWTIAITGCAELSLMSAEDAEVSKAHAELLHKLRSHVVQRLRTLENQPISSLAMAELRCVEHVLQRCVSLPEARPEMLEDARQTRYALHAFISSQKWNDESGVEQTLHGLLADIIPPGGRAPSTRQGSARIPSCDPLKSDMALHNEIKNLLPSIKAMDTEERRMFISMSMADTSQASDGRQMLKIATIIKTLASSDLSNSPNLIRDVGRIACLEYGAPAESTTCLVLRLEISRMILDGQSKIVNQNIIDKLLANITLLLRSTKPVNTDNHQARDVFDRICTLLQIVLVRYRRRLSGRYHLLLQALQALLKCMFLPPSIDKLSSRDQDSVNIFLASLPAWLCDASSSTFSTLPAQSATKFARLLQTIADPSASVARNVMQRQREPSHLNLVDETKELKREVSLHLQYLLPTFCQASLDGYIAPVVREKLIPGIYAIIVATDIELLRACNASMTQDQRTIWKDLYAEWTRFGKWNQQ